jgi:VIT1/CCC1 family predicted Fe2+/Mn2+ transporter
MAVGEYVSVSSQRDTERALLKKEERELREFPGEELKELEALYQVKGLSVKASKIVAKELTAKDAYAAHIDIELGINPDELTNPTHAALASATSFLAGAVIPLLAILLFPKSVKVSLTFISVLLALAFTGILSAKVGGADVKRATIRVVIGGAVAMAVTFSIGKLFGVSV